MADKARQVSERSLENLKLGAQSRYQGKQRHNFTVLPETVQWLKGTGNASDAIDVLVEAAKSKGLLSNSTHDRKVQLASNDVYEQKIKDLEVSLEETYLELSKLRSQLVEAQGESNFQEARWKLTERNIDEAIKDKQKVEKLNQELQKLNEELRAGLRKESGSKLESEAKSIAITLRAVINYLESLAATGRLTQRLKEGLYPSSVSPLESIIKKLKTYYD